jgi:hypothetical protein
MFSCIKREVREKKRTYKAKVSEVSNTLQGKWNLSNYYIPKIGPSFCMGEDSLEIDVSDINISIEFFYSGQAISSYEYLNYVGQWRVVVGKDELKEVCYRLNLMNAVNVADSNDYVEFFYDRPKFNLVNDTVMVLESNFRETGLNERLKGVIKELPYRNKVFVVTGAAYYIKVQ